MRSVQATSNLIIHLFWSLHKVHAIALSVASKQNSRIVTLMTSSDRQKISPTLTLIISSQFGSMYSLVVVMNRSLTGSLWLWLRD